MSYQLICLQNFKVRHHHKTLYINQLIDTIYMVIHHYLVIKNVFQSTTKIKKQCMYNSIKNTQCQLIIILID